LPSPSSAAFISCRPPEFLPETLSHLYGSAPSDSTMLMLMGHRAVSQALVGILCPWAV